MNLPEPKNAKWQEMVFDYGRQYGLGFECLGKHYAVKAPTTKSQIPPVNIHEAMKAKLFKLFWRRLGAA